MAITAYIGRAGSGKTQACFEAVLQAIKERPGAPVIYLVPDPATYRTERALAEFMPRGGFTSVRVVGFGRLAHQVLQSLGRVRPEGLSDLGRTLLLRLLMKREAPSLELLGQAARQPQFSDVLSTLFKECRAFKVTAEALRDGSAGVGSLVLQRKASELAHLMEAYDKELQKNGIAETDRLSELIELLPDSPLLKDATVIVDGFHWFTPLQEELVDTLLEGAVNGIITLTLPTAHGGLTPAGGRRDNFERPREVLQHLQEVYGTELQVRYFKEPKRFKNPVLADLEGRFFGVPAKGNTTDGHISIITAYNREREADAVCRRIVAYMNEPSHRWRDVTIMLRESETYGDVLELALERYEIPYFTDRRHPMVSHPLAEFLLGLLEVVLRRFDHDAMFRLLKTDFWPLSRQAVDELENYCLEFGVRELMWLKASWPYVRLSALDKDAEAARCDAVNESRAVVMAVLRDWWDFATKKHTTFQWCEALYGLMVKTGVPARLAQWSETAKADGDLETAAAHEQMYKQVIGFFDELMRLAPDDELGADELAVLLKEGLDDVAYSMVPPSLDHVTVTTIERGYTASSPLVFVMGLNEGVFPQRLGDEGLLTDAERTALREAGVTLAEGALVRAFNENFLLYLAMTRAEESLVLSYAGADGEGAALEASLIMKRLGQLGYYKEVETAPLSIPDGKEASYLWRPRRSLALLAGQLGGLRRGQEPAPIWQSVYEWSRTSGYGDALRTATRGVADSNEVSPVGREVVAGLLLHGSALTGSVTRLESYQRCPFAYYAQYGLKLEPRRVKQFGAPEMGTFLHESLKNLGQMLLNRHKQWRHIAKEERAELCRKVVEDTARELAGAGDEEETDLYENVLRDRLEETLRHTVARLSDWSSKSAFDTVYLEKGFGTGDTDSWPAVNIPLGGESYIRLQGRLDRVDEYRVGDTTYGLVVDYKSGGAAVTASDVYYGLKLQLVTYLLALEKAKRSDDVLPAAIVYTYVKNPRVSSSNPLSLEEAADLNDSHKDLRNSGYFTDNSEILLKLDDTLITSKGTSPYVPVRLKQNGEVYSQDLKKVKSTEQFGVMTDYAKRVMAKAGQHILNGHFPLSPYNNGGYIPCTFCQYRALCRFENTRNSYRYLERLSEEDSLARMRKGDDVYEVDRRPTTGD